MSPLATWQVRLVGPGAARLAPLAASADRMELRLLARYASYAASSERLACPADELQRDFEEVTALWTSDHDPDLLVEMV